MSVIAIENRGTLLSTGHESTRNRDHDSVSHQILKFALNTTIGKALLVRGIKNYVSGPKVVLGGYSGFTASVHSLIQKGVSPLDAAIQRYSETLGREPTNFEQKLLIRKMLIGGFCEIVGRCLREIGLPTSSLKKLGKQSVWDVEGPTAAWGTNKFE